MIVVAHRVRFCHRHTLKGLVLYATKDGTDKFSIYNSFTGVRRTRTFANRGDVLTIINRVIAVVINYRNIGTT